MTEKQRYVSNRIYKQSRQTVNFDLGAKSVIKFGRNIDLLTSVATISAAGGNEVFVSTNIIDTISSSNAGDDQVISVQGHTIDANGDFTEVVQLATLDGQNKVVLDTPLVRVQRSFNKGATDFAGDIYIYEDDTIVLGVPQTAANIHLKITSAFSQNQSLKCSLSTAKDEWLVIDSLAASIAGPGGTVVFTLETREKGSVFRGAYTFSITFSTGTSQIVLEQPAIVPPNSDIRVRGIASVTGISAEAIIVASYAKVTN